MKPPKNSIGYFEDGDIEYLTIDEAQMIKNSATGGKGFKYASSIKGSGYPVRARVASAIIAKAHGGQNKGTVLATATPFTSSPYEIYTVLRTAGQLPSIRSFEEFQDMYIMTSKRDVPMVTEPDKFSTVEVFDGISNIPLLKSEGLNSVVYRNAEDESQRDVNNIDKTALKPDETLHEVHTENNDDLEIARQDLLDRHKLFKEYNKGVEDDDEGLVNDAKGQILSQYGLDVDREAHKLYVQSKGQTFSFIDNLNKLSIGKDFANNQMRFNVTGASEDKLEKLVTAIRKKKVEYTVLKEIKEDGDFVYVKDKKQVPLGEYVDTVFQHNLVQGGELVVPIIDEAIAKQVFKELGGNKNLIDIEDYPKYKALSANLREELNMDSSAKQIIFSASITGTRMIEHFIKHLFKDLKLKKAKTMNAVDTSGKADTQSDKELGALAQLQENYNNSTEPTVLIYTERNTTGVDFNKRTKAVHLVDIPYTPDVWHQAKGRGVRQGNTIRDVQVYTYATAGTLDDAKMKILEVKSGWQEDLKTIDSKTLEYNGVDGEAIIEEATARFGGIPTPEQIDIIMEEKKSQALKVRSVEAKAKERAEHLMLIDLGRNDVGRVAKVGTVNVTEMMRVERYSHVMHLVSDVEATIAEDKDMFDLFAATFTAGTMTGAPKIMAMELIAQYEGLKRGFYSGSVGYFAFNGNMDSSIAIRTSLIKPDAITLQAGAGVVADSIPELEYLEVKNKLGALLATLKEMETL